MAQDTNASCAPTGTRSAKHDLTRIRCDWLEPPGRVRAGKWAAPDGRVSGGAAPAGGGGCCAPSEGGFGYPAGVGVVRGPRLGEEAGAEGPGVEKEAVVEGAEDHLNDRLGVNGLR